MKILSPDCLWRFCHRTVCEDFVSGQKVNKSFSYLDTPTLRSLLVCILNFDNKTSKIFSKCNHLFGRYLGETHFVHKSRAVTRLKTRKSKMQLDQCIYISMHMQNFIEICLFTLKILSKNAFWTWIRGHNYVVSEYILSHLSFHITPLRYQCLCNAYAKFYWNSSIHKILTKNAFWT